MKHSNLHWKIWSLSLYLRGWDKVDWGLGYKSLEKWSDLMPINATVTNSGKIYHIKNIRICIISFKVEFQSYFTRHSFLRTGQNLIVFFSTGSCSWTQSSVDPQKNSLNCFLRWIPPGYGDSPGPGSHSTMLQSAYGPFFSWPQLLRLFGSLAYGPVALVGLGGNIQFPGSLYGET